MAKKNNGKSLEKTIRLIQEAFKDSDNTHVYPSFKIKCESGIEREFDVLIKSKVNGYDICIAIECKDYSKKVSIDRIDAFKTKCSTVKEISKMVFVSSSGYQSGAVIQAKKFNIDLLTAEQISLQYLESLMKFTLFNLKIDIPNPGHKISVGTMMESLKLEDSLQSYNNEVIEYNTGNKISTYQLMGIAIKGFDSVVSNLALAHFVKNKDNIEVNPTFPVTLGLDIPPFTYYFEDGNSNKIDLTKVEFEVTVTMQKIISENSGRIIKNDDSTIKAHSFIFKIDDKTESELIMKPDNDFIVYHTINNETEQLVQLGYYDAATKQVISHNKRNY